MDVKKMLRVLRGKYEMRLSQLQDELITCSSVGGKKILHGRMAMLEEVILDINIKLQNI